MKKNPFYIGIISMITVIITIVVCIIGNSNTKFIGVNAGISEDYTSISNRKIGWGIKREQNHMQPDVGSENKRIMDKYNALYMGNSEKKYVYLTFDSGYEAGYTEKILEVLSQNGVKATFFITGHYLNSQPDLVGKIIKEGHIVGNHTAKCLMSDFFSYENVMKK